MRKTDALYRERNCGTGFPDCCETGNYKYFVTVCRALKEKNKKFSQRIRDTQFMHRLRMFSEVVNADS
jgi:hypothetical protein